MVCSAFEASHLKNEKYTLCVARLLPHILRKKNIYVVCSVSVVSRFKNEE